MKTGLILAALLFATPVWADCEKTKSDYDVVYCSTKIGSPVKSSDLSYCDRQSSVIVMNKIPNSPDVIFYGF